MEIYSSEDNDFKEKSLDHFGLVSASINELGIIEKIDAILPVSTAKGAKVTMGERVKSMIINGLGFINDRFYMFSKSFEGKSVKRLIGENVKAEYFTDDALGRCLDAIAEYGVTKFFTAISFAIGIEKNLLGKTAHIDTTTLLVYGDYS